ncbi:NucA/NucB deoxyribonuclease domain-containing protein [Streptomyces aurantiacus]|uniref:NucA/NucB deoxyribonuclease domain-containing protein n=1 Tax=Streptomyces aurantiacus TaxID=47760 RepID=UPI0009980E9C
MSRTSPRTSATSRPAAATTGASDQANRCTARAARRSPSRTATRCARPGRHRPGPGLSCDEYPFASTREGGHDVPANSRGTAWVPEDEQDYWAQV